MHLVQTRLSSLIYDDLELGQLGLLRAGSVFRRSDLPVSPVPETLTGGVGGFPHFFSPPPYYPGGFWQRPQNALTFLSFPHRVRKLEL